MAPNGVNISMFSICHSHILEVEDSCINQYGSMGENVVYTEMLNLLKLV